MRESEPRRQGDAPEVEPKRLIEQGIAQLLDELRQGKSERLEKYLTFSARFHRYSAHNQLLIYLQCPEATYIAGYRAWQEMGYQVRRGEKGIRILAPRTHKTIDPETGEEQVTMYFGTATVFDASQLANLAERPVPTFFTPLLDDQQELYERLARVVNEDGIALEETQTRMAQGYSAAQRIVLKEGLDSRSKILTLLHEYTHELLHWTPPGRQQTMQAKECQAEAVSYVVAHHLGIYNPFSADYLQHWGTTPKELMAELETVRRTSAYIIDRLESPLGEQGDRAPPSDSADLQMP